MKNIFFSCLAILVTFFSLNAQTLSNKQYTMVSERSADWCPLCGSWGWAFMHNLETELADKDVLLWSVHFSGNLTTPTTIDIASNLGGVYHPVFFLNEDDMDVSSSNVDEKLAELVQNVDLLNSFPPLVQMGSLAVLDGSTLNVNAKLKFVEEAAVGEFYAAIYLIKDNLIAPQANQGNMASHTNVLDKSLLATTFGNLIATGPVADGSTFEVAATLNNFVPHSPNLSDSKIAVVTWNKYNNKYIFLNASVIPVSLQNSTNPESNNGKLGCVCVQSKGKLQVSIVNNLSKDTEITLLDGLGKTISKRIGKISEKDFVLETSNLIPGLYYIHVISGNQSLTKNVFIP